MAAEEEQSAPQDTSESNGFFHGLTSLLDQHLLKRSRLSNASNSEQSDDQSIPLQDEHFMKSWIHSVNTSLETQVSLMKELQRTIDGVREEVLSELQVTRSDWASARAALAQDLRMEADEFNRGFVEDVRGLVSFEITKVANELDSLRVSWDAQHAALKEELQHQAMASNEVIRDDIREVLITEMNTLQQARESQENNGCMTKNGYPCLAVGPPEVSPNANSRATVLADPLNVTRRMEPIMTTDAPSPAASRFIRIETSPAPMVRPLPLPSAMLQAPTMMSIQSQSPQVTPRGTSPSPLVSHVVQVQAPLTLSAPSSACSSVVVEPAQTYRQPSSLYRAASTVYAAHGTTSYSSVQSPRHSASPLQASPSCTSTPRSLGQKIMRLKPPVSSVIVQPSMPPQEVLKTTVSRSRSSPSIGGSRIVRATSPLVRGDSHPGPTRSMSSRPRTRTSSSSDMASYRSFTTARPQLQRDSSCDAAKDTADTVAPRSIARSGSTLQVNADHIDDVYSS